MAFTPKITAYVGLLPLLRAAKKIIEDDFAAALIWRCSLDASTPGADYARIQTSQMHSRNFPLLTIQPAQDRPGENVDEGIDQNETFEVAISLVRAITTGDPVAQIDAQTADLIRYYDATRWALESATDAQWRQFFPASANAGPVKVQCGEGVFRQLVEGSATESAGQYERSMDFELQVNFFEA